MGANTHYQGVFSKGYDSTVTTLGCALVGIDPLPGYRVAVSNFGYTTGNSNYIAFHPVLSTGKVRATDVASGGTSLVMTGSTLFSGAASADASIYFVTISLKTGAYQHVCVYQYWASTDTAVLETALIASVAAGATVWSYSRNTSTKNMRYAIPAGASARANVSNYGGPGIFFGASAGHPMIVTHQGTATSSIDYVTGGYITA
jgi:hypothetical protein